MQDLLQSADPVAEKLQAAERIGRGVVRLFTDLNVSCVTEMTLRTGRRVDVMGIDRDGKIIVVEIKSSIGDFRADHKWHEYLAFCDRFYFAVDTEFPRNILPTGPGLIIADQFEAVIRRPAPEYRMNAARRRNLTLRFARTAADRLMRQLP